MEVGEVFGNGADEAELLWWMDVVDAEWMMRVREDGRRGE